MAGIRDIFSDKLNRLPLAEGTFIAKSNPVAEIVENFPGPKLDVSWFSAQISADDEPLKISRILESGYIYPLNCWNSNNGVTALSYKDGTHRLVLMPACRRLHDALHEVGAECNRRMDVPFSPGAAKSPHQTTQQKLKEFYEAAAKFVQSDEAVYQPEAIIDTARTNDLH